MKKRLIKKLKKNERAFRIAQDLQAIAFTSSSEDVPDNAWRTFMNLLQARNWSAVADLLIWFSCVGYGSEPFVHGKTYRRIYRHGVKPSVLAGWWDHYYWTGRLHGGYDEDIYDEDIYDDYDDDMELE